MLPRPYAAARIALLSCDLQRYIIEELETVKLGLNTFDLTRGDRTYPLLGSSQSTPMKRPPGKQGRATLGAG
jgi:hypothetical protein